jgi:hypothetical protein
MMSCTIKQSSSSRSLFAWCASASDCAGVLSDHVQGAEVAALHRLEHLGEVPAVVRRDLRVPGLGELRVGLRVLLDVLEAGELVRDRAHVSAALHVVLPAERIEP